MTRKLSEEQEAIICSMYLSSYSTCKIADVFSVSSGTIINILKRNNIERRSRLNIPILLEGKPLEIIQGHLLGDGFVSRPSTINCYFSLVSKYQDYTKFVIKTLQLLEPSEIRKQKKCMQNKLFTTHYYFKTKQLISPEYRKRWYPNGIKIIPKDLKLTPVVCLYWYIDDGGFTKDKSIKINTQSFTKENLEETILPQLQKILGDENGDIKIYMRKYKSGLKPRISIPRRYTKKFLEYIGSCPIKCYAYKWDIKPYKQKARKYL